MSADGELRTLHKIAHSSYIPAKKKNCQRGFSCDNNYKGLEREAWGRCSQVAAAAVVHLTRREYQILYLLLCQVCDFAFCVYDCD